jgi:hypothetical protein
MRIPIFISETNVFFKMANSIDWELVQQIVQPDLEKTEKRFWWFGRKINMRIHLGVMLLQVLLKLSDRKLEELVNQTPQYQVFCGNGAVPGWKKSPDHTKIEKFRNRLSVETHKRIGDYVLLLAVEYGFADPSILDVDSTVQEANMAYPSDATLMKKMALKCAKALDFMKNAGKKYLPKDISIDTKEIIKQSQKYFFAAKNMAIEKKREIFSKYHSCVKSELKDFIKFAEELSPEEIRKLPWNYQESVNQIKKDGRRYLLDVAHFVRNQTIKPGKILSFKMREVACIKKGKIGRVFQLGRIGGNFLVAYTSTSIKMDDKESLPAVLTEHQEIFGKEVLKSVTTDKGYYSQKNINFVKENIGSADGLQRPVTIKDQVVGPQKEELYNRRSGVEPVIGHAKQFGLGKSKMKSDKATLASGYRSVAGFNLHQIKRNFEGI